MIPEEMPPPGLKIQDGQIVLDIELASLTIKIIISNADDQIIA